MTILNYIFGEIERAKDENKQEIDITVRDPIYNGKNIPKTIEEYTRKLKYCAPFNVVCTHCKITDELLIHVKYKLEEIPIKDNYLKIKEKLLKCNCNCFEIVTIPWAANLDLIDVIIKDNGYPKYKSISVDENSTQLFYNSPCYTFSKLQRSLYIDLENGYPQDIYKLPCEYIQYNSNFEKMIKTDLIVDIELWKTQINPFHYELPESESNILHLCEDRYAWYKFSRGFKSKDEFEGMLRSFIDNQIKPIVKCLEQLKTQRIYTIEEIKNSEMTLLSPKELKEHYEIKSLKLSKEFDRRDIYNYFRMIYNISDSKDLQKNQAFLKIKGNKIYLLFCADFQDIQNKFIDYYYEKSKKYHTRSDVVQNLYRLMIYTTKYDKWTIIDDDTMYLDMLYFLYDIEISEEDFKSKFITNLVYYLDEEPYSDSDSSFSSNSHNNFIV